jgi:hypothetical protein
MAEPMTQEEHYRRMNTDLVFELTKYIRHNEDFAAQIPKDALLVVQVRDHPAFSRWTRKIAKANREPGQPVMYVYIEKLHPSRIAEVTLKVA